MNAYYLLSIQKGAPGLQTEVKGAASDCEEFTGCTVKIPRFRTKQSLRALPSPHLILLHSENPLGSIQKAYSPENNNNRTDEWHLTSTQRYSWRQRVERNSLLSFSYSMNSNHGD